MAIQLFGFKLSKAEDSKKDASDIPSFAPPPNEDGSYEVAPGGSYGTFVDLEGTVRTELELVTRYRDLALQAEVESAIDDIVNEAIIHEKNEPLVQINLDNIEMPDRVKDKIREEFKTVTKLLDFQNMGYDIFRRWYIDGRIYYHMMINEQRPRDGLQELRYIDPRRIRKVREAMRKDPQAASRPLPIVPAYNEYYLYSPGNVANPMAAGANPATMNMGIKISKDSVVYVTSGLLDQRNRMVLSHLHKAIKPMNQLRMLEDATVIYRLSRAPERRIFYIDVGNLPKMKAEQYLKDMMTKHKNKLVYDAATGEVRDDRKYMTMLEDFWLPRREGGRGTEITTLPGGQNLGEMDDVEYFRRKVYKSLNVPQTRIQSDASFNMGRSGEITRDEIKFSKLIDRLRGRFTHLFDTILETQLVLRGVMSKEEWKLIKENVHYDFLRDNYYAELKEQEIVNARLGILQNIDIYVGKYFSLQYVRENVLQMTEEDIIKIEQEIADEEDMNVAAQQDMAQDGQQPQSQPQPQQSPAFQKKAPTPKKPSAVREQIEIKEKIDISDEEKKLIESMTRFMDSMAGDSSLIKDSMDDTEVLEDYKE
jgi:hypothetical protein